MKLFILFLSIYGTALASQNLPKPYIKNELLILATPSFFLTTANIKTLQLSTQNHTSLKLTTIKKLPFHSLSSPLLHSQTSQAQWYHCLFNSSKTAELTAKSVQNHPKIIHAQPNYVYTIKPIIHPHHPLLPFKQSQQPSQQSLPIVNDPYFNQQWAFNAINHPQNTSIVSHETHPIVAIIDTGINLTHPDLINQIWVNANEIPNNLIDDDQNGYIDDYYGWDFYNNLPSPEDDNNHGTHIAGIIAAETNNNIGIAGLTKHTKLMALKAANQYGQLTSLSVAQAIDYAINHNAAIINLSFGAKKSVVPNEYLIESIIQKSIAKNQHVVAAAGNQALNIDTSNYIPATYDNVIAVSSSDNENNFVDSYSNFGPSISFIAPGGSYSNGIMSTIKNHDYATISGTSMAAPHVSASLALLQQAFPQLSNETHLASLKATATDINLNGKDNYYGHGLLNINESLKYTDESPPELTHQEKTFQELSSTIIITANVTDDFQSTTYPLVTLNYQFILESNNNESSWETTRGDITKPMFMYNPSKSIQLNYYLIATDYIDACPQTQIIFLYLKDITAPTIAFNQQNSSSFIIRSIFDKCRQLNNNSFYIHSILYLYKPLQRNHSF